MEISIIFDKESVNDRYACGWGVSYLIDGRVVFDAGEKSEYIKANIKELNIDLSKVEKIVISHKHWDHRGGLWDLLDVNKNVELFGCSDFFEEFEDKVSGYNFKLVKDSQEITKNIYTTGCFKVDYKNDNLSEQAIVIRTDKGISLVFSDHFFLKIQLNLFQLCHK